MVELYFLCQVVLCFHVVGHICFSQSSSTLTLFVSFVHSIFLIVGVNLASPFIELLFVLIVLFSSLMLKDFSIMWSFTSLNSSLFSFHCSAQCSLLFSYHCFPFSHLHIYILHYTTYTTISLLSS